MARFDAECHEVDTSSGLKATVVDLVIHDLVDGAIETTIIVRLPADDPRAKLIMKAKQESDWFDLCLPPRHSF
ncbi:MAG: hypothetical protein GY700_06505 [Propionibacteriaceae bacterium]|nr:hypothetical protein [Propionibacteriaceae bacterium]